MNTELKENIKKITVNNKEYKLCEFMFGVLEMDHNSPLSCVSEANNSFSIDYWKGCAWQCAYCHVQGIYEDLDENYRMYNRPIPRSKFTIEEIIDALVIHPYFQKNISVLSIATSSTEPFANSEVTENTLRIMEYFVELGYKNPFWIVTKAGIPSGIEDRLKKIVANGNEIMISICWCDNPYQIEPVQNNRFKNIENLKNTGVTVSWYMRPLVEEWSANPEQLEQMILDVSKDYYNYIDMIIPGGLRWTEGIEFGLQDIRGLEMPNLIKEHNKKTLSNNIEDVIIKLMKKHFPGKPVYFNSSCGIAHMLKRSNVALLNIFDASICDKSICYNECKNKCKKSSFNDHELRQIENALNKEKIEICIKRIDNVNYIDSIPDFNNFSYTVKQQIKKTIAIEKDKEFFNESK